MKPKPLTDATLDEIEKLAKSNSVETYCEALPVHAGPESAA